MPIDMKCGTQNQLDKHIKLADSYLVLCMQLSHQPGTNALKFVCAACTSAHIPFPANLVLLDPANAACSFN